MSDLRPRPQYGEYASSEERLAAGGLPLEPAPPRADSIIDESRLATPAPVPAAPAVRPWDGALTTGLLVFGLFYIVFTTVPMALDFAGSITAAYAQLGYGEYTNLALASAIGIAILVGNVVVYIATVVVAYLRLRRNKRAVLVPIIGGVLALIVTVVLAAVAMVNDPAFVELMNSQR